MYDCNEKDDIDGNHKSMLAKILGSLNASKVYDLSGDISGIEAYAGGVIVKSKDGSEIIASQMPDGYLGVQINMARPSRFDSVASDVFDSIRSHKEEKRVGFYNPSID